MKTIAYNLKPDHDFFKKGRVRAHLKAKSDLFFAQKKKKKIMDQLIYVPSYAIEPQILPNKYLKNKGEVTKALFSILSDR